MKQTIVYLGLAVCLTTLPWSSICAQGPAGPSQAKIQHMQDLADQVKSALQKGDLDAAFRSATDLQNIVYIERKALQPTPQEKLAKLEQTAPAGVNSRFNSLADLAKAAFDAGELDRAEAYARELLLGASEHQNAWNYGDAIFYGNMVIGRVALRRDHDTFRAKSFLLASGQTPGSPVLGSFGPNMSLASDLLTAGERDTVLEFFAHCRKFWRSGSAKLDAWTAMVKGGGTPDFGANLVY